MKRIRRKLKTMLDVYNEKGLQGIGSVTADKVGRWYRRRGNKVCLNGCFFDLTGLNDDIRGLLLGGIYEGPERQSIRTFLDRQLPVIELGGGMGIVSCIINRTLEHPERHVVVEANTDLVRRLRANAIQNGCKFSIINAAVGYDRTSFCLSSNILASGMWSNGMPISVPKTTLRQILEEFPFDRFTMVCDIEGSEVDLVRQEGDLLAEHCPLMIIETHEKLLGQFPIQDMTGRLDQLGFTLRHRIWDTSIYCRS